MITAEPKRAMSKSKITLTKVSVTKSISDLELFPKSYIAELNIENEILKRIVNTFLQNDNIDKTIKNEIVALSGKWYFNEFLDGTYAWKGFNH